MVNIREMPLTSPQIKASRACPISGSFDACEVSQKDRHGKPLRNILSLESGLIYVDPVPFKNTEDFYKTEYRKSYKGVHSPKPKHVYRAGKIAMERYSRISQYLPVGAKCLDAGSSSGEFVYLLKNRGHDAKGVEANLPYAEYSETVLDLSITKSPFSEFETEQRFDLITMFHVLEHLEHPVRDLSHLGQFLKPGGKLVIEVPNIIYPKMAFSHKWHPGHLFSFMDQTLSLLLRKAGFQVISCSPIGDGGNLWGIFEKSDQLKTCDSATFVTSIAVQVLNRLQKAKWTYRINAGNYLKFIPKVISQLKEIKSSKGKGGKAILDELYSS